MTGLPTENTDEEAPNSHASLLAGHKSDDDMTEPDIDGWGADVRGERKFIVLSVAWVCCIALPIVCITLVIGWGLSIEAPTYARYLLVLGEIIVWGGCLFLPVVCVSVRYIWPKSPPYKLTVEFAIIILIAGVGWGLCAGLPFFAITVAIGWGKSSQPERLAVLSTELEAAAAEGAYVASTCRYTQYNDAPAILGRHGFHILRSQAQGHMAQAPNLLYLMHHAGVIFELVRPDGSPYRFLKLDFSERGIEPYWKNETPSHYHDVIPWDDGCLFWCGDIPKIYSSPSSLIALLMSTRDRYYNWYFFNCAHYVTYLWNGLQPTNQACGPPMSWPVPGIPFTTTQPPMP